MDIYILVKLKGVDLVSHTAADTLRRRMSVGPGFRDLFREDYFRILPDDGVSGNRLDDLAGGILSRTTLLVNPNKHSARISFGELPPPVQVSGAFPTRFLVTETGGSGRELSLRLKKRLSLPVAGVEQGVMWTVFTDPGLAREERDELLEKIVVTRDRINGLLVNPHYQEIERIGL